MPRSRYNKYAKRMAYTAGSALTAAVTRDAYRAAKSWRRGPPKYLSSKPLLLEGFPKQKLVKLRYCEEVTMDPSVGASSSINFGANTLWRPNITTPQAHDPMGFDQWAQIYTKYTVLGAKCTMKPVTTTSANVIPGYYGILLTTNSGGVAQFTTIENILESKLVTRPKSAGIQSAYLPGNPVAVKRFSSKKFFGIKNPQDGSAYSALTTAHPTQLAYFNVWAASIQGNDPGIQNYLITIEYIALMHDPVTLDGST